jgi:hypothetical protein
MAGHEEHVCSSVLEKNRGSKGDTIPKPDGLRAASSGSNSNGRRTRPDAVRPVMEVRSMVFEVSGRLRGGA